MIEPLESRITPSSILTFIDVDGDMVKITSSAGDIAAPGVAVFVNSGLGQQLAMLTLKDPNANFAGTNLSTSVKRGPEGDGLVNIGFIDATDVDLGTVDIKGDLAQLTAGDATTATGFGVKALKVRTLGHYGTTTGGGVGPLGTLEIRVTGALGLLSVAGDVDGTYVVAAGAGGGNDMKARIDSVKVGGSLLGGSSTASGRISATGGIGTATIAHDIRGGAGNESGTLASNGLNVVKSFTVGGSVIGGSGVLSGIVSFANGAGSVTVKGSVIGGSGSGSGALLDDTSTAVEGSVKVGGSVIGGSGDGSGMLSLGQAGSVSIGGDIVGTSITGNTSLESVGLLRVDSAKSITVGGSLIAGVNASSGTLKADGTIVIGHTVGKLTIKGSLIGNVGNGMAANLSAVNITIGGNPMLPAGATTDVVAGSISIGGSIIHSSILAGYTTNPNLGANDGNAQIGSLSVGGDWVASVLLVGTQSSSGVAIDGFYGDATDVAIPGFAADSIVSKIASISIRGAVFGSPFGSDHFGFVAQQIGSFKAGGYSAKLTAGQDVIQLRLITADVTIREVA